MKYYLNENKYIMMYKQVGSCYSDDDVILSNHELNLNDHDDDEEILEVSIV